MDKKVLPALIFGALTMSSCGELKEFAQPYKLDSVSFVESAGRVTDMAIKPADDRVSVTVALNGSVRTGKPNADGVLRTESDQSVLGNNICPGNNEVSYGVKVLGRAVGEESEKVNFTYPLTAMNMTSAGNVNITNNGKVGVLPIALNESIRTKGCGIKSITFSQKTRKTDKEGNSTLEDTSNLNLAAINRIDTDNISDNDQGRRLDIEVRTLLTGIYLVDVKVEFINGEVMTHTFTVNVGSA